MQILENPIEGVAGTLTSWNPGPTRLVNPPRATPSDLKRGATLGKPRDGVQQRRVLGATLSLLAKKVPQPLDKLSEREGE